MKEIDKTYFVGAIQAARGNACPFQIRAGINVKFLIRAGLFSEYFFSIDCKIAIAAIFFTDKIRN
jgi:hypothetical protein